ncbi:hypothetical protein RM531_08770 [Salinisphaera sp. P385]|uniref:SPOR domain-containing protein n=1 Tax=Spectribacter acetivorans TaxID=3075603 RepID=A0ABU3B928_9GAMM|nr:hypothetical protein [Salinisphaera sp. P385]MDT0618570.1 hypothetical protein [Salinisphaera sp. P385]
MHVMKNIQLPPSSKTLGLAGVIAAVLLSGPAAAQSFEDEMMRRLEHLQKRTATLTRMVHELKLEGASRDAKLEEQMSWQRQQTADVAARMRDLELGGDGSYVGNERSIQTQPARRKSNTQATGVEPAAAVTTRESAKESRSAYEYGYGDQSYAGQPVGNASSWANTGADNSYLSRGARTPGQKSRRSDSAGRDTSVSPSSGSTGSAEWTYKVVIQYFNETDAYQAKEAMDAAGIEDAYVQAWGSSYRVVLGEYDDRIDARIRSAVVDKKFGRKPGISQERG